MKRAKIIGFISTKGGVGKTTTVANLGYTLAKDYNKEVLIVDANFSGPNLALHFGETKPKHTLHDVLNNGLNLQKAIVKHDSGLHILPASIFGGKVDSSKFHQHIASLRGYYDLILLDSSPTLSNDMMAAVAASDELFVITTPDKVTLDSTLNAVKTARQKRTYLSGIILNKVRGKNFELNLNDIQDATKVPVVSVLDDEEDVLRALARGIPVSSLNKRNNVAVEYKKLSAALVGDRYVDTRLKARVRSFFNRKLSQDEINRAIVMVSHY